MKRGILYSCMRKHGYSVLALGQHCDDIAESFLMSAFFNGQLNTMKAHYSTPPENGSLRIIRPLIYTRERVMQQFAKDNYLPIIADNCPACFAAPKERHRVKVVLSSLEHDHPQIHNNILKAVGSLIAKEETGRDSNKEKSKDDSTATVGNEEDANVDASNMIDEKLLYSNNIENEQAPEKQDSVEQNQIADEILNSVLKGAEDDDFNAEMSMTACGASGDCAWVPKTKRMKSD
eukprot:GDKJ01005484.1.p1 GENE.GDKJ01005484.1~~GDKJ01005484.1.p1  ORF type:complete len:269 (-),score=81.13 GDKJ01005484.1:140-841(-)